MDIGPVGTPALRVGSYVVADGAVEPVVDPQCDIDRMLAIVEDRGVRLTDVFETRVHNDYVTGAVYHANAADTMSFERGPITAGQTVDLSATRVRAVATPEHTRTHLASVLEVPGEMPALFAGTRSIAASPLSAARGQAAPVDGDYDNAAPAGMPITEPVAS